MKIQVNLEEKYNKSLKIHKIRGNFKNLQEALQDVLKRFFEKEIFYMEQNNLKEDFI